MKKSIYTIPFSLMLLVFVVSCGKGKDKPKPPVIKDTTNNLLPNDSGQTNLSSAQFNPDSAYKFIEKQVSFGPRIPNTTGHKNCGDYLYSQLKQWSDEVIVQNTKVTAYTGAVLNIRNFIARFDPQKPNRIALFAHWDTRPFADRTDATKSQPVPGADDGGSGVGILLELARLMHEAKPNIGVDIILFDGEDYGNPGGNPQTYCLGSQYWAKNNPISGYMPNYGILLDMVGAQNAKFLKEGYSLQYAPAVVDKVWNIAQSSGYGQYFIMANSDPITDDHFFVNTMVNIPTIDIINYDRTTRKDGFGDHWHTPNDNMDIIDKNVLKAVGQTLMNVIYSEH